MPIKRFAMALAASLGASACFSTPASRDPSPFCLASVWSYSNPEAGARGDFSANVAFDDLMLTRNSIGYGAAGGRNEEITIADGVLHLARPDGAGGYRERTGFEAGEGGYMVQLVSPLDWRPSVSLDTAHDIDALGAAIRRAAETAGCAGDARLAFRIEAQVVRADWSLDTLPQRGDFITTDQDAVIVGLYASIDQSRHFVTQGRNIHAHIVFPALGVSGHLKQVEIAPDAVLRLQAR
jgi:hypothetical protein